MNRSQLICKFLVFLFVFISFFVRADFFDKNNENYFTELIFDKFIVQNIQNFSWKSTVFPQRDSLSIENLWIIVFLYHLLKDSYLTLSKNSTQFTSIQKILNFYCNLLFFNKFLCIVARKRFEYFKIDCPEIRVYIFLSFADGRLIVAHGFANIHSSFCQFWDILKKRTDFSDDFLNWFLRLFDRRIHIKSYPYDKLNEFPKKNIFLSVMHVIQFKRIWHIFFLGNFRIPKIDWLIILGLTFKINVFIVYYWVRNLFNNLK